MQELVEDHDEVGHLLQALMTAFDNGDPNAVLQRLDLFWARLAMHIRAEHLHLFPTVLRVLEQNPRRDAPSSAEAEKAVEQLHLDHDFFMQNLASAVKSMRELARMDRTAAERELPRVRATIAEVESRLAHHNQLEEKSVYLWARQFLSEDQQAELIRLIDAELTNLPPRFATNAT